MTDPYAPPNAGLSDRTSGSEVLRPSMLSSVSWRVASVLVVLIVFPFTLRGIETMTLPHTPYQLGGAIFDFGFTLAMGFLAVKAWRLGKRKLVAAQPQLTRVEPHINKDA